jgi:hypothetical protein
VRPERLTWPGFIGRLATLVQGLALFSCRGVGPPSPTHVDGEAPDAAARSPATGEREASAVLVDRPYDLDADVRERIARVRGEFGSDTPVHVEGSVFVLVAPDRSRLFEPAVRLVHDALGAYFNERFSKGPDRAVTVFVFGAQGPYDAYCAKRAGLNSDTLLGFYSSKTREIFANVGPGVSTLTHEIVHPIVQTDFPGAPAWLDEGLGSLYEMPVLPRPGEIHGGKNWRLARLRQALSAPTENGQVRIETLLAMSDDDFRGRGRDLHYAMARNFCQWLDDRGALWPFYRAWRADWAADPTGDRAFQQALGAAPAEVDAEWVDWARHL